MIDVLGKRMCCWEFRINATPNLSPARMATHSLCRYYGGCVCVCVCVCVCEIVFASWISEEPHWKAPWGFPGSQRKLIAQLEGIG